MGKHTIVRFAFLIVVALTVGSSLSGRAAVVPVAPADGEVKRGTQHFDAGFAKYGKPGDALQRRIELYLLDCGVTEEEIAAFRSIMLELP